MARAMLLLEMAMQLLLIFRKHAPLTQFFAESVEVVVLEVVLAEEEQEVVSPEAAVALEVLQQGVEYLKAFSELRSTSY